jgi:hypothetical protein
MTIATNLFSPPSVVQRRWPWALVKNFSSVFMPLMAQGSLVSLERLQLVNIAIALCAHGISSASMTKDNDGNFMSVTESIVLATNLYAECRVRFFVRGRQQYFKHPAQKTALPTIMLSPVSEAAIEVFMNELGQVNSALYDREIARLSGREKVLVPSLMVISCCLEYALNVAPLNPPTQFELDFFSAVGAGDQLAVGHVVNDSELSVALYATDKLAVTLRGLL